MAGQYGEVTTSTYHCSNPECQKNAEKEMARMKKKREEQEEMKERRLEARRQNSAAKAAK